MRLTRDDILDSGQNLGLSLTKYIDKLEREFLEYKNIEEELGVDLITLFKGFSCIWYKKGNELKVSCHIALIDWAIYVLEESMTIGEGVCLQLKDYGKTWALTKEELE